MFLSLSLRSQRDVLAVAVIADAIDNELLGNELRDADAHPAFHQMQHQIQRRDAPGTGEAVPIDGSFQ